MLRVIIRRHALYIFGIRGINELQVRIIPRHIMLAVRNDEELNRFMKAVTIRDSGCVCQSLVCVCGSLRQRYSQHPRVPAARAPSKPIWRQPGVLALLASTVGYVA